MWKKNIQRKFSWCVAPYPYSLHNNLAPVFGPSGLYFWCLYSLHSISDVGAAHVCSRILARLKADSDSMCVILTQQECTRCILD